MRQNLKYLIGLPALVIYTVAIIQYTGKQKTTLVYMVAQKVFSEFNGTKELRKKMHLMEERQKSILDSLSMEIQIAEKTSKNENAKLILSKRENYSNIYSQFLASNKEKSKEYEEGLWDQINQYVGEYGKKEKYDFIMGATGDGNIMFADSSLNKTDEVIRFINEKYAGR